MIRVPEYACADARLKRDKRLAVPIAFCQSNRQEAPPFNQSCNSGEQQAWEEVT